MLDEYEIYQVLKTIDKLFDNKEASDIVVHEEIIKETKYDKSKVFKILKFLDENFYIEACSQSGDNKILAYTINGITQNGYNYLSDLTELKKSERKEMTKVEHVKDLLQRLDKIQDFADIELENYRDDVRMILANVFPDKKYLEEEKKISFFTKLSFGLEKVEIKEKAWLDGKSKYSSFLERIIKEQETFGEKSQIEKTTTKKSNEIFIVHGHDDVMKLDVEITITKLKLKPIILHDCPNQGKTLIEKLLDNSNSVGYAIVLLSPDDIGKKKESEDKFKPRARQNVIFEMGLFVGVLKRENVFILLKETESFELPSDYAGLTYTPYAKNGTWKMKLVQELQCSGYRVSANDLI